MRNSSLNHSHKQPSTSSHHHHYVLPCDQNDYHQSPRNHELHKLPLSSTIYDDETVKQEEEEDNRDQDSFSYNHSPLPNLPLTITMKTSEDEGSFKIFMFFVILFSYFIFLDESSTDSDEINYEALNESMNITWSQDAVLSLIESCSKFADEIASKRVYKVPKESWEKVSQDLKEKGFDYGPNDCQCKFARLRSTYINILCYPNISDHAKWPYYEPIRLLIGTQPIEIRQKEMKFVAKVDKVTKQPKEVKTSEVHVAMIQLVRKYIKDFKNMKKPKSETWARISQELNQAGFDCTTKTIQGAFHRMRYTFLHLLTTVPNEDDAQAKWPYFYLMQDIDLTPFRLKGKNDYKTFGCDFRRRRRANDNSTATTVSSTLSSENDANSPTFDLLQVYFNLFINNLKLIIIFFSMMMRIVLSKKNLIHKITNEIELNKGYILFQYKLPSKLNEQKFTHLLLDFFTIFYLKFM